ncbi:MAG: 50S ribosomal protein L25/general stress protein Ctc [Firmicutes bacterium]|uniref:Large ribosomal subunit protein bL25 n=1 Tax=Melghirimyces thermohalophilus TaxID=1236220 RepID=A0A1G6Q0U1_9BACL|nr:50S ribosomal protein L25/general stress protein Ctc [Melghirimyces thermohalophilus]MDA8353127.1 50S ribosomal protein L25/general stress protein Ctc [Bacillota bacterium]SDC86082.1 large subunit ribosomal protein L25 [Melghirimyces thermohalophilus]
MAYTIAVEKRDSQPRSNLTRLRREGRVPAVVYGKGMENELVHMESSELIKALQREGMSGVYQIRYPDGQSRQVMVREVQQDRIKDKILHVDFKEIKMNEMVEAEVAVELEGQPQGVKMDGILQTQLRTVHVRCLPGDIPERITGEISELDIGDSITVGQLNVPENVEIVTDSEEVVASVLPPQVEQEKEAEEEAEAASEAGKAEDRAKENQEEES